MRTAHLSSIAKSLLTRYVRQYDSPRGSTAFRLLVQHCRRWSLQRSKMMLDHTRMRPPRALKSVSVMATYGQKVSPNCFPSHFVHWGSSSVRIAVLYPAWVARLPVGAENRNNSTGIPCPSSSTPRAIHSRRRDVQRSKVPSRIIC